MVPGAVKPAKFVWSTDAGRHVHTFLVVGSGIRFCNTAIAPGNRSVSSRLSDSPEGENRTTCV
jgi:hypothetical protein